MVGDNSSPPAVRAAGMFCPGPSGKEYPELYSAAVVELHSSRENDQSFNYGNQSFNYGNGSRKRGSPLRRSTSRHEGPSPEVDTELA